MPQDSEEAAEFVATVRTEHVKMKQWFNESTSGAVKELKSKYGSYPGLWKEVLNWSGWKEVRKEYLKQQQTSESSTSAAVPRKRKSRWGTANEDDNKRQSRWGNDSRSKSQPHGGHPIPQMPVLPGIPSNLPPEKQKQMRDLQGRLRYVNERLDNVDRDAARVDGLPRGHRDRSPSPPPIYGTDGKRQNTRAVRWRERFSAERQDIMERLMNLNPRSRQQGGGLLARKRIKKVPIPIDKHPNYNFIGLILGPRGKTQKELEAKTGCKISIRGRGSMKEGARGRRDGKEMDGANEPLHVVITGDDQGAVDAAEMMIQEMLVVIDDETNVFKQQQLRELALLNGTLQEAQFCDICGEKGHRAFECPKRFAMRNRQQPQAGPAMKCAICGDTSHPTRDCRMKPSEITDNKALDSEYQSFMAELDGKPAPSPSPAAAKPSAVPSVQPVVGGAVPPPPPSANIPPLPVNLPPPPKTNLPPPPMNLPPPPVNLPPPPQTHLPVPPINLPPPRANASGSVPPPPPHAAQYSPPPHEQMPPPPAEMPSQGQPLQQQQYPAQQQVRPGQETQAWDPNSYYGYGGGAGGFNWWEQ